MTANGKNLLPNYRPDISCLFPGCNPSSSPGLPTKCQDVVTTVTNRTINAASGIIRNRIGQGLFDIETAVGMCILSPECTVIGTYYPNQLEEWILGDSFIYDDKGTWVLPMTDGVKGTCSGDEAKCATDIKTCNDGTRVMRSGLPDCNFSPCPEDGGGGTVPGPIGPTAVANDLLNTAPGLTTSSGEEEAFPTWVYFVAGGCFLIASILVLYNFGAFSCFFSKKQPDKKEPSTTVMTSRTQTTYKQVEIVRPPNKPLLQPQQSTQAVVPHQGPHQAPSYSSWSQNNQQPRASFTSTRPVLSNQASSASVLDANGRRLGDYLDIPPDRTGTGSGRRQLSSTNTLTSDTMSYQEPAGTTSQSHYSDLSQRPMEDFDLHGKPNTQRNNSFSRQSESCYTANESESCYYMGRDNHYNQDRSQHDDRYYDDIDRGRAPTRDDSSAYRTRDPSPYHERPQPMTRATTGPPPSNTYARRPPLRETQTLPHPSDYRRDEGDRRDYDGLLSMPHTPNWQSSGSYSHSGRSLRSSSLLVPSHASPAKWSPAQSRNSVCLTTRSMYRKTTV